MSQKAVTVEQLLENARQAEGLNTRFAEAVAAAIEELNEELNGLKASVSDGKSAIASAITDKGVSTSPTADFSTMADHIRAIRTGIELSSLAIINPPAKTTYRPGETFDPAGISILATYSNGAAMTVTGYSYVPSIPLTLDDTSVTIQYTEQGVTKTVEQLVTVRSEQITVPTQNGALTYNGSVQAPQWNNYNSDRMTISGDTSGTNAGNYTAKFIPLIGYCWPDGSTDEKSVTWSIARASVAIPTVGGTKTYNGSEQTVTLSGYDSAKMTLGGTQKATNAGTYTATATPTENYQWTDGGTGSENLSWTINKAAGSLTLSASGMSLDASHLTGSVTVTRPGDGAISASSSNTGVATVSVSGTTVTVTAVSGGNVTITINVAAGTNYTAPAGKTVSVTVTLTPLLANSTPAEIQAAAADGTAPNYWSVGDKVGIALGGTVGALKFSSTYYAFIIGFDHNSAVEGTRRIHFQFGKTSAGKDIAFCDSGYQKSYNMDVNARFVMNTSNTATGGWESSYMRDTVCSNFLQALPSEWRSVIMPCNKYSDNVGSGMNYTDDVSSTSDSIWLLSEFEVFGKNTLANSMEPNYQKQYDYYKNGNSKIKYKHNLLTTACYWWLRSADSTSTTAFRAVNASGATSKAGAYNSLGFSPGFVVG